MLKQFFKSLLLLMCVCVPCGMQAKTITSEEAARIATDFFSAGNVSRLSSIDALELVCASKKSDGTPVYYVFNAKDSRGFIIISADDNAIPIVGYSYESSFMPDNVSDATVKMIANATKQVAGRAGELRSRAKARVSGKKLIKTAEWSQESPFNNLIPNRRLVGCVGTAMATVMKYHNHPASGTGSLDGTDFNTPYDWKNMRTDNYRYGYSAEEAKAVSTLMAHCAISVKTDFGMSGSSAFEVRVPAALISYFGYAPQVSYKKRSETDRATWDGIIINEIEAGRPVIYSGQDVSVGHAFVCDGYEMRGTVPYFHINWGWGGSANGYFSSDALNPTVSTSHSFNDQTTIIYNIKPAANTGVWSPIHLTSDERQVGMTSDVANISAGTKFTVRAGALKNVSYGNFAGRIAVALYSADGKRKAMLCNGKTLSLQSMQIMQQRYVDFDCIVPAGTTVANDDIVRLATMADGTNEWQPVTGDLITTNEIKAKNNTIQYFTVDIPATVNGAVISGADNKVIKGRDYTFKVVPASKDMVVTVKANGFILSPNSGNVYRITNVTANQQIRIIVQTAAEVVSKRSLWVSAGGLESLISEADAGTIKELTLYGTIDVRDFTFIRERMKLTSLDISGTNIVANGSNPANAIPTKAFSGYRSLQEIILPQKLSTLKNGCFNGTGLRKIEIPASVGTYEYNIFLNCSYLSEVIVRRNAPAWVNWCVFTGTPKAKLVVPVGASAAYKAKDNWKDFKNIVEENPSPASSYKVVLQEKEGVKITPETENLEVQVGKSFSFTVETDERFGDAMMEVYANTTKLNAGSDGRYTVTVNANTMIHANFVHPTPTIGASSWKLTDAKGGIGLATDVINVLPGKAFSIRANALAIPKEQAAMFYAAALTDANGAIKEFISPIFNNSASNYGNLPCTFNCQVKESSVREGNKVHIVTSYDKKDWYLVKGTNNAVKDAVNAIGNDVVYHKITMPSAVKGATIQGAADQIVRGMDFACKIMPVSVADAITVLVNGKVVADRVGVAQVKVESVREDLDIAIQVVAAGNDTYTAINIHTGELASKVSPGAFPSRLKLMGEMNAADFKVLQDNASKLVALDLTDVTIKSYPNQNSLPSMAFASSGVQATALTTILLPNNLESIEANAFYRCAKIQEIIIPENVTYIGSGAFTSCINLKKIVVRSKIPVKLTSSPFPTNISGITLEVPKGAEAAYAASAFWKDLTSSVSPVYYNIQIDPERVFQYSDKEPLTHIEGPSGSQHKTVQLGLPNFRPTSYKPNPGYREGVAFKLYDNKQDVTGQLNALDYNNVFARNGVYLVPFYGESKDPQYLTCPQDHVIDVVFHYNIKVNDLSGKAKIEFVDLDEASVWRNAEMNKFVEGSTQRPTLYKEGGTYRFTVTSENANMTPVVKMGGETIYPDENGVYAVTNLQSDVTMDVTMALSEDDEPVLDAEDVTNIGKEEAAEVTSLELSGTMTGSTFANIRNNFTSLENLDLSGTNNTEIPDNAFAGMESLINVVVSDNVTAIGKDAFKGCSQLESLTLNSVTIIGNGAFDGCSSITSIMLNGNNNGRQTRAAVTGITDESFKGINPNCIIYMSKGLESMISAKTNIVLNGNGKREAMTDIILNDNSAFRIPASFDLGKRSASLPVKLTYTHPEDVAKDWKGIILPFVPTRITDINGNEYAISSKGKNTISVMSFKTNGTALERHTSIEANKPYMVRINACPKEDIELIFSATSTKNDKAPAADDMSQTFDMPITPEQDAIIKTGRDFCLYGCYAATKTDNGMYLPDAEGYRFVRIAEEEVGSLIAPFSVYARANSPQAAESFAIGKADTSTGIDSGKLYGGTKLYRSEEGLVIVSAEKRVISIYTVSGMCVTTLTVNQGSTTVALAPGAYIIDGVKVVL